MTTEAPVQKHEDDKSGFHVSRFTSCDYLVALLAGLLAVVLYLRTLAPGLLAGDSGEFQMAAWLGGFAHPTGYPLYLLLGAIWTHLVQTADPAWRMNLFSALWGGVAVGLTYLLAFRMVALTLKPDESAARPAPRSPGSGTSAIARGLGTAARLAAFFAALVFATTPTFWSQTVVTEVYTLNMVLLVAVLLGMTIWASQPRDERSCSPLYWTAAIYGLSLTHHRSMLLIAPAIGTYFWLETRRLRSPATPAGRSPALSAGEGWHIRLGGLLRVVALVLLPLLLYLYIPIRAPYAPYAEVRIGPEQTLQLYRPTVDWFLGHVSGQVFGNALGASPGILNRLTSATRLFAAEVTWVGLTLGLAGLVWLAKRSRVLLALTALSFVAVCIFNLFYGIGDIFVFYIPAYFIWVLWMALGVFALGIWLVDLLRSPALSAGRSPAPSTGANRWPHMWTVALLLPAAVGLALPVWSVTQHYGRLDQSQNNQARAAWQTILAQPIPQDAILVSNDRDEMVPFWYLQHVEGVRPDLTGLFPLIQPTPEWADIAQVVATAQRSGRPVMLIKPMPGLETKFRLAAAGSLVRVLGPAVVGPPQRPQTIDFGGAIRLTGYDLEPSTLGRGDVVKITLYWQPLRQLQADYTTFVHLIDADGQVIGQSDHRPGGVYYPTSSWKPGDTIVDTHTITLTDPGRAPYAIEAGLYSGVPTLEHLGQPERIGLVG